MKIVHMSTHDAWGGAAIAAHRLHTGLRAIGEESTMFVAQRHGYGQDVLTFVPPRDLRSRLERSLTRRHLARALNRYAKFRPPSAELFSDDRSEHDGAPLRQLPPCDILHLHWISGFPDYRVFFPWAAHHAPIVWTMHDMNAFTGGCHCDLGCAKYNDACGACPQLGSAVEQDLSRQVWKRKQMTYGQVPPSRMQLVAPSRWMANEVGHSALLRRFPVKVIPYGVDLERFVPRDKAFARSVLGLPQDARVLLFAAHTLSWRLKGFSILLEALAGMRETQNLHLVSVGSQDSIDQIGIPYHPLGYISNERLLSTVYSAADLCVVPTLQDNLPNIVIESLACGTPVVGFDVGGMSDLVREGQTGLLVPVGDPVALREGIRQMLGRPETIQEMGHQCRRIAVEEYSLEKYTRAHLGLYESISKMKDGRAVAFA